MHGIILIFKVRLRLSIMQYIYVIRDSMLFDSKVMSNIPNLIYTSFSYCTTLDIKDELKINGNREYGHCCKILFTCFGILEHDILFVLQTCSDNSQRWTDYGLIESSFPLLSRCLGTQTGIQIPLCNNGNYNSYLIKCGRAGHIVK